MADLLACLIAFNSRSVAAFMVSFFALVGSQAAACLRRAVSVAWVTFLKDDCSRIPNSRQVESKP